MDPQAPTRQPSPLHQDRAFRVLLAGTLLAVVAILAPFLYAFAVAAVLVVVTWPTYAWLVHKTGNRPRLAAALMMAGLLILVALPVSGMAALAVGQAVASANQAKDLISRGNVEQWTADLEVWIDTLRGTGALDRVLPPPEQLLERSTRAVEELLLAFTRSVGAGVPGLLGGFGRALMDALVFLIALFSGYVRGPDMVQAVRRLSPLRPEYLERLFDVFRQLSTNVALGMVVAGAGQGASSPPSASGSPGSRPPSPWASPRPSPRWSRCSAASSCGSRSPSASCSRAACGRPSSWSSGPRRSPGWSTT